jgi:(aminoalkyl)phosphonate N-acetyltransferase
MKATVRRANEADNNSVYELLNQLKGSQHNREAFEQNYLKNINDPLVHYLVAEQEFVVIGFISLHVQRILHHSNRTGEIQELIIDENHRGKGIGKVLMEKVELLAKELNLEEVELTTRIHRTDAQEFYKSLGYTNSHLKFVKELNNNANFAKH